MPRTDHDPACRLVDRADAGAESAPAGARPLPFRPARRTIPIRSPSRRPRASFASMCASSRRCLISRASPARMMRLVDETGTKRFFVNDMRGPIYSVSYDGKSVSLYLDINDPKWGVSVQSQGRERGFQNFAFHPDFRPRRRARRRQVLHVHGHDQSDARAGLHDAEPENHARHRACSSGRRKRQARRPTTAAHRASSSVSGSRLRITTPATSRSIRRPLRAARSAGGSTSASPTAAAAATR